LEAGSSFEYLRETYNSDTNTWGETSEVDSANTIWLTRSNAKALNLIDGNEGDFDASIRVSNSAPWHFDSNSGVPGDKYDLLTVAKHEIAHTLGFISGTDVFDLLAEEGSITDQDLDYVSPMDLLRYSEASSELGVPDWTRGQTYFSLDGGDNNLGDFATGISNFRPSNLSTSVEPEATGTGGNLTINSDRLSISDGAQISVATFGEGNTGALFVTAQEIEIAGSSQFRPSGLFVPVELDATGNGGNLTIDTGSLLVTGGGQIAASTAGTGDGGEIVINATESIELIGASAQGASGVFANAIFGTGDGGNISLISDRLLLLDGATINASSFSSRNPDVPPGSGKAGNIEINQRRY
jgi:hypothetical protein